MAISKIITNSLADNSVTDAKLASALGTIVSDLESSVAILGLKEAIAENRAASNLGNAFIDVFQDNSGISSNSSTFWSPLEYITVETSPDVFDSLVPITQSNFNSRGRESWSGNTVTFLSSPDVDTGIQSAGGATPIVLNANAPWQVQFKTSSSSYGPYFGVIPSSLGTTSYIASTVDDQAGAVIAKTGSQIGDTLSYTSVSSPTTLSTTAMEGSTLLFQRDGSGTLQIYKNGSLLVAQDISTANYQIWLAGQGGHVSSISVSYANGTSGIMESTGNFVSTTQTASSTVDRMGIVVLYKNEEGTATLNTDLVVELSANDGSNYTTTTLTDGGTFSSGIKIAVANPVTITNTGTAPKYRLTLANQSSGSKETQIWGVGLLY